MSRNAKPGNVSDFRRLQPTTFVGTGTSLEAKQRLVNMINLLRTARMPEVYQVEIVKIQLLDVTSTWCLAEKNGLVKPIQWEQLTASFYKRFFPKIDRRKMEYQF